MIQIRYIHADGNQCSHRTHRRSLPETCQLLLPNGLNEECHHHQQDNQQIVVGHLNVVGAHFKGGKYCRHDEAPQVFAAIGKHHSANHRRQICQRHHLPDVPGGDNNKEIGGECPHDGSQRCQPLAEIERTQQDVEAQQIDENIPHILGQPQVISLHRLTQHRRTVVRRSRLIGRHAAEQRIRPARTLSRTLIIFRRLLPRAATGRGIMLIQDAPLNVGREEISERNQCKNHDHQHVGQPQFPVIQCLHLYLIIPLILVPEVLKQPIFSRLWREIVQICTNLF